MFHVRQKASETPDVIALGPSTAAISWGEIGIIVLSAMVRKYTVVKAKHLVLILLYLSSVT
jgi:hypothetical protein